MKGSINKAKNVITLEDQTKIFAEKDETAADFISRVKAHVKNDLLDSLELTKEAAEKPAVKAGSTKTEKIKKESQDPVLQDNRAKEKAEAEAAKVKAKAEADEKKAAEKEAKAKEKAELAEAKAKEKAEAEAAKAKEKAEREEALAAERQAAVEQRSKELIESAEKKAVQMVEDAKVKADEYLAKVKAEAEAMLTTGSVGIDPSMVAYVKSKKGQAVSFKPFGATEDVVTGTVIGVMCDKRVDGVFFKIKDAAGRVYHKNAATAELTFEADAVEG